MFTPQITATLWVRNGDAVFEFYKKAFGTAELYRVPGGGVGQISVVATDFWVAEGLDPFGHHWEIGWQL